MTYYQQTLLIPMPTQRLGGQECKKVHGRPERIPQRNRPNHDINSILSVFD